MSHKGSVKRMNFAFAHGKEPNDNLVARPVVVVAENEEGLFVSPVSTERPKDGKERYSVALPKDMLSHIGLQGANSA